MDFALTINKIEVIPEENNLTDIVKHVTWTYTGTENDNSYTVSGGNNFTYDADNFTPFASLTNEQIKQWCLTKLEEDGMLQFLKDTLQEKANEQTVTLVEKTLG